MLAWIFWNVLKKLMWQICPPEAYTHLTVAQRLFRNTAFQVIYIGFISKNFRIRSLHQIIIFSLAQSIWAEEQQKLLYEGRV